MTDDGRSARARSGCITRAGPRPAACQVTVRENGWQKDAGEHWRCRRTGQVRSTTTARTSRPVRGSFEYNKDPNGTMYAIHPPRPDRTGREQHPSVPARRRDRRRRRPSPDGKSLAYHPPRPSRQSACSTCATARDGRANRPLFGKRRQGPAGSVGRAWASIRLYAWTPDGRVDRDLGSRARSGRVDVGSLKRGRQKFRFVAQVEADGQRQRRGAAGRRAVHAAEFAVQHAPRRHRAVLQRHGALDGRSARIGRLYVRYRLAWCAEPAHADGRRQGSRWTQFRPRLIPSCCRPDGRRTCLHDVARRADCGRVGIASPATQLGRRGELTDARPLHYHEHHRSRPTTARGSCTASCGGRRRSRSDARRRAMPGIYVVPADRSAPARLAREGWRRSRGSTTPAPASTCVRSATRSPTLPQHRRPDGRIAGARAGRDRTRPQRQCDAARAISGWQVDRVEERFKTFVAAFPHTGRPIDVGPGTQTYPVQRVSRDATCTGRAMAAVSTGRWGPSSSRES